MSKKLIYLIVLVIAVVIGAAYTGSQYFDKSESVDLSPSLTNKVSSQSKEIMSAENQDAVNLEINEPIIISNDIFTSSSPIASVSIKKVITDLHDSIGINSTIRTNTLYWSITYSNGTSTEYSLPGSSFKFINMDNQVESDYRKKIENYFLENNFKEDMRNNGVATVKGSRGFQNKNIVCVVKTEHISKDRTYSKFEGIEREVMCGDIRDKVETDNSSE